MRSCARARLRVLRACVLAAYSTARNTHTKARAPFRPRFSSDGLRARTHRVGRGCTIGCASATGTSSLHLPPLLPPSSLPSTTYHWLLLLLLPAHRHAFHLSLEPNTRARPSPSSMHLFSPRCPSPFLFVSCSFSFLFFCS